MVYPSKKACALAGAALLGLGGLLATVRARVSSEPAEVVAAIRLALKDRQWSRGGPARAASRSGAPPQPLTWPSARSWSWACGRADRAVSLLTSIAEADPHAALARLVAGQIEKGRNRARRMEALFRESIRVDPKLVPPRRELILLYAVQARRADLNDQYRAVSANEPLEFDEVLLWTATLEDIWTNDTIRSQLELYLAADPEDRASRMGLAGVFLRPASSRHARPSSRHCPIRTPTPVS